MHTGPVQIVPATRGGANVLCFAGHLIEHVRPDEWPRSAWSTRAADPAYRYTCGGKLSGPTEDERPELPDPSEPDWDRELALRDEREREIQEERWDHEPPEYERELPEEYEPNPYDGTYSEE
jgi:hypothetical protein